MASDMRCALVRALLLTTEAEEVRSSEFTAWQRARPGRPWQVRFGLRIHVLLPRRGRRASVGRSGE
jgi:hypothetical protein